MAAGYQNLYLEQGTTFNFTIMLDDIYGNNYDLSNSTVVSQIRKSYYSSNATAQFVTTISVLDGSISMSLDANTTSRISPGRYVYDSLLTTQDTHGGQSTVVRILEGVVDVSPSVTR